MQYKITIAQKAAVYMEANTMAGNDLPSLAVTVAGCTSKPCL